MPKQYWLDELDGLIVEGGILDSLALLEDESVEAIVTDPPYSLNFMGQEWDRPGESVDAAFGYYLSGLVDGEGCFRIHREKSGSYYACHFQIKLRRDDRAILEQIHKFLGVGRLQDMPAYGSSKPQTLFIVDARKDCEVVRAVFQKFPLRAKKRLQFAVWSAALDSWLNQGRGNRWHGPADKSAMKAAWEKMKKVNKYTDPPWSGNPYQDWCRLWAKELLRVLKPGGHIVVFGGTRTHHRMWCAIEDAGFEVREMLLWLYGQGMPKSLDMSKALDKEAGATREVTGTVKRWGANASGGRGNQRGNQYQPTSPAAVKYDPVTAPATDAAKQWEGWGTGLKPSVEPILLARKPLSVKTVAANVLKHGTGALNIDATRNAYLSDADKASATPQGRATSKSGAGIGAEPDAGRNAERAEFKRPEQKGRWPANVIIQCTCDDPQPVPETARERQGEPSQEQRYDEEGATNLASKPGVRREGGGYAHQPDCPAGMLDAQTGVLKSGMMKAGQQRKCTKGEGGYHGNMPDEATAAGTYGDAGGASRFFATMRYSDQELILSRAKAIMEAWNSDLANTVDENSNLPSEAVASALSDAVILASQGGIRLNDCQARSTSATPSELKRLCESAIALILSIDPKSLPASFHIDTGPLSADHAKNVVLKKQTDTTMITPSHTSSDGCAVVVTLTTTKSNTEAGAAASVNKRFNYCPKATKKERGEGNVHPTVKPLALMRWLIRLVTPPDGVVLDPFCGSGSTLVAAADEGVGFIGIDVSGEYCAIARTRLEGRTT